MNNRDALLEAAIVCLRERGYGATTARDLASAANVSLGAIRYHFGSTEALLNEALAESVRRWITQFQLSLGSRVDPEMGLLSAVAEIYEVFAEFRPLSIGFVEALARAQRSPTVREQLAGHYAEFRDTVATLLSTITGQAPAGNSAATGKSRASILMAMIDGLMLQWLLDPASQVDVGVLRQAIADLTGVSA